MGFIRHDAVIVTLPLVVFMNNTPEVPMPDIEAFKASLPPQWRELVVGPVFAPLNGYVTYLFAPDGSKETRTDSDDGDRYRDQFAALFDHLKLSDHHHSYDLVRVRYGGHPNEASEPELIISSDRGTQADSMDQDW